jgi:hypothetical protein
MGRERGYIHTAPVDPAGSPRERGFHRKIKTETPQIVNLQVESIDGGSAALDDLRLEDSPGGPRLADHHRGDQ